MASRRPEHFRPPQSDLVEGGLGRPPMDSRSMSPQGVCGAHLATTTVVDSLSPQRSAGRGLGRGAFDLCLPVVPAELLLSPTLSSTPRRRGVGGNVKMRPGSAVDEQRD